MNSLKSEVSKAGFPARLNRRVLAVMLGALVLGSTFAVESVAQPGRQNGHDRDRGDDRRGDRHDHRAAPAPRFSPPAPLPSRARDHAYQSRQPSYRFRSDDRARLQRYYHGPMRTVRADRRPYFSVGHAVPVVYRPHIAVLPVHVRRHLPPPPRGYQVGYYQGYSVVYDPVTFTILSVLDLLSR